MNTLAIILVAAGLASVLVGWGTYLATIPRGTVPLRPVAAITLQLGGMGLAIAGVVWSARAGQTPGAALIAPAGFATVMAVFFMFLLSQRKTPVGNLKVAVGDTLLPFASTDSSGASFHTDSFADTRVLLKFFRGSW